MADIREMILSNAYLDFIIPVYTGYEQDYSSDQVQLFNAHIGMFHRKRQFQQIEDYYRNGLYYALIPKLYSLMDTVSLEASGITQVQNLPALELKGQNTLIGFIDTGIDYTHPAFRRADGSSRILGIWDQTIQTGTTPFDIPYGSAYSQEDIDRAIQSEDPYAIVPSVDAVGHGTFLAGVASGSALSENEFSGAAPESAIAVVKLKEAKEYLKELFFYTGSGPVYQETDIMMGIRYLLLLARQQNLPVIICIGLGTNQGPHSGDAFLSKMISEISNYWGAYVITAGGNEGGRAHHFFNQAPAASASVEAEILVTQGTLGFTAELWGNPPEIYEVEFESPLGEVIQRRPVKVNYRDTLNFILEDSRIFVVSEVIHTISGSQLIFMRFIKPSPGVWKIRVYARNQNMGGFHIWLPVTGFSNPDVIFLRPDPDTTITIPGVSGDAITTAAYNAYNNSLFIHSSRGFTITGGVKPQITAPGVNVFGPVPNGGYSTATGTSAAAAITAGACALLVEWGTKRRPQKIFNIAELSALLVRGARRGNDRMYPNREWGYGILDIYQIFKNLISL
ncbi:MAG: S8 family peptidase [Blautia sp.]